MLIIVVLLILCLSLSYQDIKYKNVNEILAKVTFLLLTYYLCLNTSYFYIILFLGIFFIDDNIVDDIFLVLTIIYMIEFKMFFGIIIPMLFYVFYADKKKIPLLGIHCLMISLILFFRGIYFLWWV